MSITDMAVPEQKQSGPKTKCKRGRYWLRCQFRRRPRRIIAAGVIALALTLMFVFSFFYRFNRRNEVINFGVSFSTKYATELGINWQEAYTALLDDLGFRNLRLMSYWDQIEPVRNLYNFTELDWQMDEAAKRGAKVMLAIGWRQPRWPECHTPSWVNVNDEAERERELFEYIAVVVQRYSEHPALESYQLENEYFNTNFGECPDHSRGRLIAEFELVKSVDPQTPVVISFADQIGFPFRGPVPDRYATSLYRANYVALIGYFPYPIPSHFYSAKALLIDLLHRREVVIHELQVEPWGPSPTVLLSDNEQARYMDSRKLSRNIHFARLTGMKDIYLWGGEWWYWRKTNRKDDGPWETVRREIRNTRSLPPWQLF